MPTNSCCGVGRGGGPDFGSSPLEVLPNTTVTATARRRMGGCALDAAGSKPGVAGGAFTAVGIRGGFQEARAALP